MPGHGGVVDQPTLTAVDQQPHGLVEVLGGHPVAIPEFATEVVAVASPRDIPVWCPFGVGGDLADLCHREVQGVPGLRMERLGHQHHVRGRLPVWIHVVVSLSPKLSPQVFRVARGKGRLELPRWIHSGLTNAHCLYCYWSGKSHFDP